MTEEMKEYGNMALDADVVELTSAEKDRLAELEAVIAENFQGFYAVGCALAEINTSRLYLATHETFEDYCRERFEISRPRAYQYIEAKNVMDNVRHGGQDVYHGRQNIVDNVNRGTQIELLPMNERQVRPLTRLEPDVQIEAWKRAVASAPVGCVVTAKHVSQIVKEILGEQVQKKTEKIKSEVKTDTVSPEFINALWALIEVVRAEVAKPMKKTMRENMRESIRRVEKLLAD